MTPKFEDYFETVETEDGPRLNARFGIGMATRDHIGLVILHRDDDDKPGMHFKMPMAEFIAAAECAGWTCTPPEETP